MFTGDAAEAFESDLLPIINAGGRMTFGRLRPQSLAAFEKLAMRPDAFCGLDERVAADKLGVPINVFRNMAAQVKVLTAQLAQEAASSLGFRGGQ